MYVILISNFAVKNLRLEMKAYFQLPRLLQLSGRFFVLPNISEKNVARFTVCYSFSKSFCGRKQVSVW